ncbi:MAG: DUF262 domain-containing protein, partial [Saprospiraceae bacterium]|nr:DUF262 domain-containing protein [Saprospiraceae bacterium]
MSDFITLNTILGNGKSYMVPIYQRDYSGSKDDWEDLWHDILEIPNDKTHYLGYIVLQPENESKDSYWIIDGQQRLTTLSILCLAVTSLIKKWSVEGIETEDNKIRFDKITERYLGNFSLSKLSIDPKLTLNRNNDDYYKSWLLKLRQPIALSKLKPSQKLLQNAFDYYFEQLQNHFKLNKSGADLSEFLEKIVGNGIIFTQIVVTNDLDAYKVFESLNARGVKLSTADLLKNYLFKLLHHLGELDLNEAERQWQNMTDTIRTNDLTTYIRQFWNSKNKLERQPSLFKAIKREINTAEKALHFLNDLEQNSFFYTAFNNPNDDLWDKKEERSSLNLLYLLNETTCFSLMIAALNNLSRMEFKKVLKELSMITFRYHLCDLNPNEAERVFSEVAKELSHKKITSAKEVILALKSIYVSDDNFEQSFSTVSMNTRRKKDLVKYILVKMENQIENQDYQPEEAISSIEHILPENPGISWDVY